MISYSFDFNVTSTRIVTFTAPSSLAIGSTCQFNITISRNGVIYGNTSFVQVIPSTRLVSFMVGAQIPLGISHFTALITTLSVASSTTAAPLAPSTAAAAPADADTMNLDVANPA